MDAATGGDGDRGGPSNRRLVAIGLVAAVLLVAWVSVPAVLLVRGGELQETGGEGVEPVDGEPARVDLPACGPVEFDGEGEPDVLVVSDLPLAGDSEPTTRQLTDAIRLVLRKHRWKAGETRVGYQSCDDANSAGESDERTCARNAEAYAENESVVAVIGPWDSGCAAIEIPILNRARGGGLAVVSPGNTYPCLTVRAAGCLRDEPSSYYPTRKRNYARVIGHDAHQAAALALFAKRRGVQRVFVLNDEEIYGRVMAVYFRNAAKSLGLDVVGVGAWDARARSYDALMRRVGSARAQALVLAGLANSNGSRLIRDKVAVLGPNDGKVKLLATDGFAVHELIERDPVSPRDMFVSLPAIPPEELTGPGVEFRNELLRAVEEDWVDPYSAYAAQAAELVLDAIARSDGTRQGVLDALFESEVEEGLVGSFEITGDGDPSTARITIDTAASSFYAVETVEPPPDLVAATLRAGARS